MIEKRRFEQESSITEAVKFVSSATLTSEKTLWKVWSSWDKEGIILDKDKNRRGGASILHVNHERHLDIESSMIIHEEAQKSMKTGFPLTSKYLAALIEEKHGIKAHPKTVAKWLHTLKYEFGLRKLVGTKSISSRKERIRVYIQEYHYALMEQAEGKSIIVFMDETYLHQRHRLNYGWYGPDLPTKNEIQGIASKGKRVILLHALTLDGMLVVDQNPPPDDMQKEHLSAELIFEGIGDFEDYHKNINKTVFMLWITKRLIPTFKAKYPGKKMILVMDNASYHHPRDKDWVATAKMTRDKLASWILPKLSKGITIYREGQAKFFSRASLFNKNSKYAPRFDELQAYVNSYIEEHQINRNMVQKEFDKDGFQIIYTPPYVSSLQPIELVWAHMKSYIARTPITTRSIPLLIELGRKGLRGDKARNHKPVDAVLAR
ncbi:MAG TPA: hypothetical protein VGC17_01045, partial [Lactovum miscens]|uniref:hypothetical protein n=1 Tax=Lactovum miscens TaxID=190387 RepID=UPI002ED86FFF